MFDIRKEIEKYNNELIEIRRWLHKHPELSYKEFETAQYIQNYLTNLGIENYRMAGTGVVGYINGNSDGKTVMLRADIDGIPQTEENNFEYKSINDGVMHGCGHDAHTAMLLIAAKIMNEHKDDINGTVKLMFQLGEEEGACFNMINEGITDGVDASFATHIWTPIESGKIGLKKGAVMANVEEFELEIIGQSGHTSAPHAAKDTILPMMYIIDAIQSIETRVSDPLMPITIVVGHISGGSGRCVICGNTKIGGTIRFLGTKEDREVVISKFEKIIKNICEIHELTYKLEYPCGCPAVICDDDMYDIVKRSIIQMNGDDSCIEEYVCLGGEDYAEVAQRVPSGFYFIGSGNKEKGTDIAHHHSCFDIDEDVMTTGVEMHIRNVINYLDKFK